jgi:hypothetical protein
VCVCPTSKTRIAIDSGSLEVGSGIYDKKPVKLSSS